LEINNKKILICNCEATMDIDDEALSKACKLESKCKIHNNLCGSELDVVLDQLKVGNKENKNLLIACTQQEEVFENLAEENNFQPPGTFNIREYAGWSKESKKSVPKISALINSSVNETKKTPSLTLNSLGRCFVYTNYKNGDDSLGIAFDFCKKLNKHLGVTLMISNCEDEIVLEPQNFKITKGNINRAQGYFSQFQLDINNFSEALPSSKSNMTFGDFFKSVDTECDIIIDLSENTPMFTGDHKRDCYFRASTNSPNDLLEIFAKAIDMIGEFEKPIYVNYNDSLCAHSRNEKTGCSKCLDVCPAGAIQTSGDVVSVDPGICGGCGFCGSVCPSGAIQTDYPSLEVILGDLSNLHDNYIKAGGKNPTLVLFDNDYGNEVINILSRHGSGLPANLIPYSMHSVGRVGHDILVSSIAIGYKKIFILLNPKKIKEFDFLPKEIELANALLSGVAKNDNNTIKLIEESDPEKIGDKFYEKDGYTKIKPSSFVAVGAPRGILRAGIQGLSKSNNNKKDIIPLPNNSPYGTVDINIDSCTICLSCVSACPAGALQDNPDSPQLLFREDACLQCGICAATCPEKAISLNSQFNLNDNAMSAKVIIEDQPFDCIVCGKTFGSTKSIERIIEKLSTHTMFEKDGRTEMLKMCEDCRVGEMFKENDKMLDAQDRPKPRTTDDYLN